MKHIYVKLIYVEVDVHVYVEFLIPIYMSLICEKNESVNMCNL